MSWKIEVVDYEDLGKILDWEAVEAFRHRALNPDHPVIRGTSQNPDIYFQAREAVNRYYEAVPDIVEEAMREMATITGREHHLFDYHGAEDADRVIIAMGSVCEAAAEVADYLNAAGEKVGVLTQYRPLELNQYLGSGSAWDLDKRDGGLFVLPPYAREKGAEWYRGTADAIYQNLNFVDMADPDYVLILSGDHIYTMDYAWMLESHKKNKRNS